MSLQIVNTLPAGLAARARALRNPQTVLGVMGAALVAISRRAFSDPALRPSPWLPHKPSRRPHALLRDTGALYASIRVLRLTNETVTVGSDLPYAAVHQFGSARRTGRGGGIPARPFLPYDASGNLTPWARKRIRAAARAELRRRLGV